MEKVIYLTNGSAALSESYQQVESLKGTGKSEAKRISISSALTSCPITITETMRSL